MALRRLGVYGANNETKKEASVQAADFAIAGLEGFFERKFDKAFAVQGTAQLQAIFGKQISPSSYGWDAAVGFFANLKGTSAKLYVASHVGYTGSAIDAVRASQDLDDGQAVADQVLRVADAYQGEPGYGANGNRTGVTIEHGDRFATVTTAAASSSSTKFALKSVAGIYVGDLVKFVCTGAGVGTVWKKITAVNAGTSEIEIGSAIGAIYPASGDAVSIPGFKVRVWRKDLAGQIQEQDVSLGASWLTTESEVTKFYAPNVFESSSWVALSVLATTPTDLGQKFPKVQASIVYPTNGADGTAPTTASHWSRLHTRFDNLPVRMLANVETTDADIQKALETYAQGRDDSPKVIWVVASDQTKAQLTTIGNNFQRGDAVLGIVPAHWLKVPDPFNTAANAPYREVPNAGHVMGLWCRSISNKGIHFIPATKDQPLFGVAGVVGDQFLDDQDRTDLAEAGINCIQELPGYGVVLRNFFTCSTAQEFMFANGILMRDFIKVSAVDSLQTSENTPNTFNRVKEDKVAILSFLYKLWNRGSTGGVAEGETFGQSFDDAGNPTKPEDHFEVVADLVNNPQSSLNAGNRNLDVYFSYPAPAGSIRIGVGILLRS